MKEVEGIYERCRGDRTIKEFLQAAREGQKCFMETMDSLQATRPFYKDLFRLMLEGYHERWTDFVRMCWNVRLKEFDV